MKLRVLAGLQIRPHTAICISSERQLLAMLLKLARYIQAAVFGDLRTTVINTEYNKSASPPFWREE